MSIESDAINRVLDLHHRNPVGLSNVSTMRGDKHIAAIKYECGHCRTAWPCFTIRAVEGKLP